MNHKLTMFKIIKEIDTSKIKDSLSPCLEVQRRQTIVKSPQDNYYLVSSVLITRHGFSNSFYLVDETYIFKCKKEEGYPHESFIDVWMTRPRNHDKVLGMLTSGGLTEKDFSLDRISLIKDLDEFDNITGENT